jgi:cardiolipin-specific phospholipase
MQADTVNKTDVDEVQSNSTEKQVGGPLSHKKSWMQWLKSPSQREAELHVLQHLDFFPISDGKREAHINQIEIGKKLYLNEFEIINTETSESTVSSPQNMVILHGYGAGLAFFFRNYDKWSSIPGSRTFSLDLLGFGRSSRPNFSIPTKDLTVKDENGRVKAVVETENWFIDSIEKWRMAKKIDRFTLMGHSMGGYLAAAYAFKYPQHVDKLIMMSPAGVERGYVPELEHRSFFKSQVEPQQAPHLEEEINVSQTTTHEHHHHHNLSPQSTLTNEKSTTKRNLPNWILFLWNSHVSPFVFLRLTAGFAPRLISHWSYRRFSDLSLSEQNALHMYSYKTFTAPGSGEYALTRLLAPGALAREPLVDRVAQNLKCPSIWIYGENDWMNTDAGREAVQRLRRLGVGAAKDAEHYVVDSAGHHVYLDNPPDVDKLVVAFLNKKIPT